MEKKDDVINDYNQKNENTIMIISVGIIVFIFLILFFINKNI